MWGGVMTRHSWERDDDSSFMRNKIMIVLDRIDCPALLRLIWAWNQNQINGIGTRRRGFTDHWWSWSANSSGRSRVERFVFPFSHLRSRSKSFCYVYAVETRYLAVWRFRASVRRPLIIAVDRLPRYFCGVGGRESARQISPIDTEICPKQLSNLI